MHFVRSYDGVPSITAMVAPPFGLTTGVFELHAECDEVSGAVLKGPITQMRVVVNLGKLSRMKGSR